MSQSESLPQASKTLADVLEEEIAAVHPNAAPPGTREQPEAERLKSIFRWLHAQADGRSALCLSGGGIRSASFGLGVLQRLAKCGGLEHFDFLSTVSGGGYLGSWLSAWIKREGRDTVISKLAEPPRASPLEPEWSTVRFLRAYSNYLAPRLGLLSADSWTLVATFLRNMLLNWLVLIPAMIAALFVPRLFMAAVLTRFEPGAEYVAWTLASALMALSIAYEVYDLPGAALTGAQSDGNKRAAAPPQSDLRFFCLRLVPLALASMFFVLGWAWHYNVQQPVELSVLSVAGVPLVMPQPPGTGTIGHVIASGPLPLSAPSGLSLTLFFGSPILAGWLCGFTARRRAKKDAGDRSKRHRWREPVVVGFSLGCALLAAAAIRWFCAEVFPTPTAPGSALNLVCFGPALLMTLFLIFNYMMSGLASPVTDDEEREWWGRSSGWMLAAILALAIQSTIVYWGTFWLETLEHSLSEMAHADRAITTALGGLSGIAGAATAIIGFSARTAALARQSRTLASVLLVSAAVAFIVLVEALLAYGTHLLANRAYPVLYAPGFGALPAEEKWWYLQPWLLLLGPVVIGLITSWTINVNRFSLHTMYRNRLVRAYLGASNAARQPHRFTDFDPADNPRLTELSAERPLHIINIALNLVSTEDLAWQERKAQSFTASRLHCGARGVGYLSTQSYGDGISLGTAMTISGAAANPNMGYNSSPIVALLMTLFNVRLGWWLPNPGPEGRSAWHRNSPAWALGPLCAEALGLTNRSYRYVNLSDGGHFENLGLYEMVLRRCRSIVVIDGGQDSDYVFEDLGNAVRKIRIDLGIPIEIDLKRVSPKLEGEAVCCALGTIKYNAVDSDAPDGRFIYLKPLVTADVPADVRNYHSSHSAFPHESTNDQFFSESQLESYRMLGWHAAGQVCGGDTVRFETLEAFFQRVATYTAPPCEEKTASTMANATAPVRPPRGNS